MNRRRGGGGGGDEASASHAAAGTGHHTRLRGKDERAEEVVREYSRILEVLMRFIYGFGSEGAGAWALGGL